MTKLVTSYDESQQM